MMMCCLFYYYLLYLFFIPFIFFFSIMCLLVGFVFWLLLLCCGLLNDVPNSNINTTHILLDNPILTRAIFTGKKSHGKGKKGKVERASS